MVAITVCDDELEVLQEYESYFHRYEEEFHISFQVEYCQNPDHLFRDEILEQDLILLDIQMGEKNGIDIARKIRSYNEHVMIIFSTNYLEYALQGYEVCAFRYLKKPLTYDGFSKVLTDAFASIRKSKAAAIMLKCGYDRQRFQIQEIMYCETDAGHLRIQMENGESFLANIGISALEERFKDYPFFRCHKAFLINLYYVQSLVKNDVRMRDGNMIPVSRHRMKGFMEALMSYWGDRLR